MERLQNFKDLRVNDFRCRDSNEAGHWSPVSVTIAPGCRMTPSPYDYLSEAIRCFMLDRSNTPNCVVSTVWELRNARLRTSL